MAKYFPANVSNLKNIRKWRCYFAMLTEDVYGGNITGISKHFTRLHKWSRAVYVCQIDRYMPTVFSFWIHMSFSAENYFKGSQQVTWGCQGTSNMNGTWVSEVVWCRVPKASNAQPHLFSYCLYGGPWIAYTTNNINRRRKTVFSLPSTNAQTFVPEEAVFPWVPPIFGWPRTDVVIYWRLIFWVLSPNVGARMFTKKLASKTIRLLSVI